MTSVDVAAQFRSCYHSRTEALRAIRGYAGEAAGFVAIAEPGAGRGGGDKRGGDALLVHSFDVLGRRVVVPGAEREEVGEAVDLVAGFGVEHLESGGGDEVAMDVDQAGSDGGRLCQGASGEKSARGEGCEYFAASGGKAGLHRTGCYVGRAGLSRRRVQVED
jgi:hypothetical protein